MLSLFYDKAHHVSCVVYCSVWPCGTYYIGEFVRNSEIRWNEYITRKDKKFDRVKPFKDNFNHEFCWFVLSRGSKNSLKYKMFVGFRKYFWRIQLCNNCKIVVWKLDVFSYFRVSQISY